MEALATSLEQIMPLSRPDELKGNTIKIQTGCGSLFVIINYLDGKPFEIFAQMGKTGGCASAQLEGTSRLISLLLRSGMETSYIVKQLRGIRCSMMVWDKEKQILSCQDAIANAILEIEKIRSETDGISAEKTVRSVFKKD